MTENIIGPAADFWRLRITRIDAAEELDFEWHDDILWREPAIEMVRSDEAFVVEAVSLAHPDAPAVRLAVFPDEDAAREFAATTQDDLADLTRSQFELRHLPD